MVLVIEWQVVIDDKFYEIWARLMVAVLLGVRVDDVTAGVTVHVVGGGTRHTRHKPISLIRVNHDFI